MAYFVRWLKDGAVVAERRYESLDDAKSSARYQLPIQHLHKGATSAVVYDESGMVHMQGFK